LTTTQCHAGAGVYEQAFRGFRGVTVVVLDPRETTRAFCERLLWLGVGSAERRLVPVR
jgi:hypothetical protein